MSKPKYIDTQDDDFRLILSASMRYGIGRRTYMPSTIRDWITKHWHLLTPATKYSVTEDLAEAVKKFFSGNYPLELGSASIDASMWIAFLIELLEFCKRDGVKFHEGGRLYRYLTPDMIAALKAYRKTRYPCCCINVSQGWASDGASPDESLYF